MTAKWCLWLIQISAIDGSIISEQVISQPKPIAECIQMQAGQFSRAVDGRVGTYECRKAVTI